jgi:hypothetical protein
VTTTKHGIVIPLDLTAATATSLWLSRDTGDLREMDKST